MSDNQYYYGGKTDGKNVVYDKDGNMTYGPLNGSKSLNRYAYMEGNPVSYLDPFGLSKMDTSGLHSGIGMESLSIALIVFAAFTYGVATPFVLMVASEAQLALTYVEIEAYLYDLENASSNTEEVNEKTGLISIAVSVSFSFLPFDNDMISAIVDLVWNMALQRAAELNEELGRIC